MGGDAGISIRAPGIRDGAAGVVPLTVEVRLAALTAVPKFKS